MKKFIRVPYEEESRFSQQQLKERLDKVMEKQKELHLYKLKGSALFLLSENVREEYTLSYYNSYKKDMCDTCLRFYLTKGLERSGAKGFFCKPRGIWACFWGVIATLLIDFCVITYGILFIAGFDLNTALMISFIAMLVRGYICMSLMQFGRERMKLVKEEMLRLLRDTDDPDEAVGADGAEAEDGDPAGNYIKGEALSNEGN